MLVAIKIGQKWIDLRLNIHAACHLAINGILMLYTIRIVERRFDR
jgi:hypothetical protein